MTPYKTYTCTSTSTCTHTCPPSLENKALKAFSQGGVATESGLGQWQSPVFRLSDHLPPAVSACFGERPAGPSHDRPEAA